MYFFCVHHSLRGKFTFLDVLSHFCLFAQQNNYTLTCSYHIKIKINGEHRVNLSAVVAAGLDNLDILADTNRL